MLEKVKFFRPHFTDRAMQKFGHLFPSHLPPRTKNWRDKYEASSAVKWRAMAWAKPNRGWWIISNRPRGDFFVCTPEEGSKAFLHRFAAAGHSNS